MNKLIMIFLILTLCLRGFSQLNKFNLADYKLPDLDRKMLEADFRFSGNNNFYTRPNQSNNYEYSRNQYNSDFNINYNHYLNNIYYQQETNLDFVFLSNNYNTKLDKELSNSQKEINPSLSYHKDKRSYYESNSFYETNTIIDYQFNINNNYSLNTYDSSESKDYLTTHSLLASFPIKLGRGRIEQIQDARHAIYIFEELSKVNKSSFEKSNEEINEFAHFISKLKNKRIFDSRLRKITEIENIDSFFISKDYIDNPDAKYFTTLSDYWDYGNRPVRYSGTRISGVVLPSCYFYNYKNPENGLYFDSSDYSFNSLAWESGFEFKHEKPINLYWQNSIDINGYIGVIKGVVNDKINDSENKIRIPNLNFGFHHTIGYYPNSRTDMSLNYSVQYFQFIKNTKGFTKKFLGLEGKGTKFETELAINYGSMLI